MPEKPKLSKKQIILIVIAAILLVIVGVVICLKVSSSKTTETMNKEIKQETVQVKADYKSENLNYNIDFYSKDDETADYIAINVESNVDVLNETELKLAKEASKLINGLNIEYTNNNGELEVKALIQRDKINQDMIDLAMKIQIVNEEQVDLLEKISQGNLEAIKQALNSQGYKVEE